MTDRTPLRAGLLTGLPARRVLGLLIGLSLVLAPDLAVRAVEPSQKFEPPPPAWPTSPFHGVISGATGQPIPCRCRFNGGEYKLGETVCMHTHLGVQLARCDLFLNNTTWVPIGVPCTISEGSARLAVRSLSSPWNGRPFASAGSP